MISLTKEEMNEINGGISFGSKVFLFGGLIYNWNYRWICKSKGMC